MIRVCPKGGKCKLMRRSIRHLYPLEVNNRSVEQQKGDDDENEECERERTGDATMESTVGESMGTEVSHGEGQTEIPNSLNQVVSNSRRSSRRAAQIARDRIIAQELS